MSRVMVTILLLLFALCAVQARAGAIGGLFDEGHLGDGDSCPNLNQGNPINIATGNKYQKFQVYKGQGEFPLELSFNYNSGVWDSNVGKRGGFWSHSYSHYIYRTLDKNASKIINIVRPNGKHSSYYFLHGRGTGVGGTGPFPSWKKIYYRDSGFHDCEVLVVDVRQQRQFIPHADQPLNGTNTIVRMWRSSPKGSTGGYITDPEFTVPDSCGLPEGFMRIQAGGITEVWKVSARSAVSNSFSYDLVELVDENGVTQRISRHKDAQGQSYTTIKHTNGDAIHFLDGDTRKHFVGHAVDTSYGLSGVSYPKSMFVSDDPNLQVTADSFSSNAWSFDYSDEYMLTNVGFTQSAGAGPANVGGAPGGYVSKAVFKYEAPAASDKWHHQTALTGYFRTEDYSSHIAGWGYDEFGRAYRSYHGPYHADVGTRTDFPTPSMTEAYEFSLLDDHHNRRVTDHLGRWTNYSFKNNDGEFASVQKITSNTTENCAGGRRADYTYYLSATVDGRRGQKQTKTDAKGFIKRFKYYGSNTAGAKFGRLKAITYAEGTEHEYTVNYDWNDSFQLKEYTTPDLKTEYDHHANGRLKTVTQTDLKILEGIVSDQYDAAATAHSGTRLWTYSYTYHDNEESVVATKTIDGPRSDVEDKTTFEYDVRGNLRFVRQRADLDIIYEYSDYNLWGMPGKVIDPAGLVTEIEYWQGASGLHIKSMKAGSSNGYHFEYDHVLDRLAKVTLPSGVWYRIYYTNVDGGVNSDIDYIETNSGEKIDFSTTRSYADQITTGVVEFLNAGGSVVYTTTRITDALDRLYKQSKGGQSDGEKVELNYDANSNLAAFREFGFGSDGLPKEITSEFGYDGLNQLTSIEAPDSGVIDIEHDHAGNQESVRDSENRTTLYVYNGFGDVVQRTSPDTGVTKYFYDEAGNLSDMIRGAGKPDSVHVKYSYDALHRLTKADFPGEALDELYRYDQNETFGSILNLRGRLAYSVKGGVEQTYVYDPAGRLGLQIETVVSTGGITERSESWWSYDQTTGLLNNVSYPGGLKLFYDYDSQARVSAVNARVLVNGVRSIIPLIEDVQYEPFGPMASLKFVPASTVQRRVYDLSYNVWMVTNQSENGPYHYAKTVGRDKGFGNVDSAFLSTSSSGSAEYDYVYDNAHRLESAKPTSNAAVEYQYDYNLIGDRTLKSKNGSALVYQYQETTNGGSQITHGRGGRWGFDHLGQLRDRHACLFPRFSADGRLSYTLHCRDHHKEMYAYNALGQRVEKRLVHRYTGAEKSVFFSYGQQGELLHESAPAEGVERSYVYLDGLLIAMIDLRGESHELYGVTTDQVGAPVQIVNSNADVVWEARYSPFGEVDIAVQAIKNNIRFPGQYHDEWSGLYYNYFRYYDPSLGRYIQSDPIGLGGGINTYGYVHQNPLRYTDPTGQFAIVLGIPAVAEGLLAAGTSIATGGVLLCGITGCLDDEHLSDNESSGVESCPDTHPDDWEKIPNRPGAYRPKGKKEPIFEQDRSGDRSHGGSKWKKWDRKRDWEKGKLRDGTYDENGRRLRK